ncbi:MAG: DUF4199 domain-containing protein [Thiohalospira sp.]
MEEKSNSFFKTAINLGVILGLALIIYSILLFFFNLHLNKYLGYVIYVIIIAFFIWGVKYYRDNNLNGIISFSKALGLSTLILLFASVLYNIYSYLLVTVIDPDYIDKLLLMVEEQLLKQGIPDEQIELGVAMQKKMMKPLLMSLFGFIGMMFFGFIIALITSAIVKKEGDPYQSAMQGIDEK